MKDFYLALGLLVTLLLTSLSGTAQSITLQAEQPYYFSTSFQVDDIEPSWTDRILSAVRMDDQIAGDQWVYPQLIERSEQVYVQVRATDVADNGVERRVTLGQPQQVVVRGIWDGFFGVTYSWTLAPQPEAAATEWTDIGYHFVWGQPTLSYLYRNTVDDPNVTGTLGAVEVTLDYAEIAPAVPQAAPNQAPVLAQIGELTATEGEVTIIILRATDDAAEDELTFSASAELPAFATLTDNGDRTASLRIASGAGDAGAYAGILVTVSDGELSSSETLTLSVAAPVVVGCVPISILPCEEISLPLPVKFSFNGDENGIYDRNGQGIGFTMVDAPSNNLFPATPANHNVPGMQPELLTVVGGKLVVHSTKGIHYQKPPASSENNSQVNALGVRHRGTRYVLCSFG